MRLAEALQGVRRIGVDTAPLIYLIERHPVYIDRMLSIMRLVDGEEIEGVGSIIALAEVLAHPLRLGDQALAGRYEAILLNSRGFRLVPVDAAVARRAADLRARHTLRTPDALHVATAIEAGCEAFLTNDHNLRRVGEIRVLVLDDLEAEDEEPVR